MLIIIIIIIIIKILIIIIHNKLLDAEVRIIIVCLQLPVIVFTKNTVEYYNSVLYVFWIIGHTHVGLD